MTLYDRNGMILQVFQYTARVADAADADALVLIRDADAPEHIEDEKDTLFIKDADEDAEHIENDDQFLNYFNL